jgi:hypothetical protein
LYRSRLTESKERLEMNDTFYGVFPSHAVIVEIWEDTGGYDGAGAALAKLPDGQFMWAEYSHCSCDGPEDTMSSGTEATLEEARSRLSEYHRSELKPVGAA